MAFANRSRIEQTVEALAQFNATPGAGITRLSYTTEYRAAQAYLKQELEAAGLSVRLDPIGNLIGRKEGIDRSLAAIAVGPIWIPSAMAVNTTVPWASSAVWSWPG